MRQQHHQTREPPPLVLTRGDKLVDDDLPRVGKVAELRLPDHQTVGDVERVTVLEPQHAVFGQRRVVNLERRLLRAEVLKRDMWFPGLDVEERRVPVNEGTAQRVLPAEPYPHPRRHERGVGEHLARCPVERTFAIRHLELGIEQPRQLGVRLKAFGKGILGAHQLT